MALGSRATLPKLGTAIFTHKPAPDPPALSASSVVALQILLQWGGVTASVTASQPLPLIRESSQRRNTNVFASPPQFYKWKGRAIWPGCKLNFIMFLRNSTTHWDLQLAKPHFLKKEKSLLTKLFAKPMWNTISPSVLHINNNASAISHMKPV